jgi:hypothetical protein
MLRRIDRVMRYVNSWDGEGAIGLELERCGSSFGHRSGDDRFGALIFPKI